MNCPAFMIPVIRLCQQRTIAGLNIDDAANRLIAVEHLIRRARLLWFLFLLTTAAPIISHAAAAEPDAVDRPAVISERATRCVLLAIARAGIRLVAVGERGIVLLSDDNGISWQQAQTPVSISLTNVYFVTTRKGWAVGHAGVVLHTDDAGKTWSKQLDSRQINQIAIAAIESGARRESKTDTTKPLPADEAMDTPLFDVYFVDEARGMVVGAYGVCFATDDGGKTWVPCSDRINNPHGKHLYAISAFATELYIAGEQGALYRSTNAGKTFTEVKTPYTGSFSGVLQTRDAVIVYGLRGNAYRSNDAGTHWHKIDVPLPVTLSAGIVMTDGSVILASEAGGVLRSTDQGHHFYPLPVEKPLPFTGIAQAADGSIVFTSAKGISRVMIQDLRGKTAP